MNLASWLDHKLPEVAKSLGEINAHYFLQENTIGFNGKESIYQILELLRAALFPEMYDEEPNDLSRVNITIGNRLREASVELSKIMEKVLEYQCRKKNCGNCDFKKIALDTTMDLLDHLPEIREILQTDIEAAYSGDPAAKFTEEIILSYPSIEALTIYRIAHFLYEKGIPLIPRIMTESAHQKTGIDINPGAKIGKYFFIDHGTGVVIGETAFIGEHVKLYQGVTLGAKSFPLDECGNPIKDIKRHPDIEDYVVIYAGATILGGDTLIGHHSVIGGNVWLTHSVPPHSTVYNSQPSPTIKRKINFP
jgi:serine O-acetyltransferase